MSTHDCLCDPSKDKRVTGYWWMCPHGKAWLCYGEGQNAWMTITKAQYKAIDAGMDVRLAIQKV